MMQLILSKDGSLTLPQAVLDRYNLHEGGIIMLDMNDEGINLKPRIGLKRWLGAGAWAGRFQSDDDIVKHVRDMRDEDD